MVAPVRRTITRCRLTIRFFLYFKRRSPAAGASYSFSVTRVLFGSRRLVVSSASPPKKKKIGAGGEEKSPPPSPGARCRSPGERDKRPPEKYLYKRKTKNRKKKKNDAPHTAHAERVCPSGSGGARL